MNRTKIGLIGVMLLCSSLPACGSSPTEDEARTDQALEVFNWWTNPGEVDAINAVIKSFADRNTQTTVTNTAVPTNSKAQEELAGRMKKALGCGGVVEPVGTTD